MAIPLEPQAELFDDLEPGIQFMTSDRVESIARRLIRDLPEFEQSGLRQAVGDDLRVLYIENTKPFDQLRELPVCGSFGKAIKASPVWRDLAETDAVLWIREVVVRSTGWPDLLEATIFHGLLHFECAFVSGAWRLALRKHDVQAFNESAARYRDSMPDVRAFLRAAAKFGQSAETAVQEPFAAAAATPAEAIAKTPEQAAADVAAKRARRRNGTAPAAVPADDDLLPGELHCEGSVHVPNCGHFDQPTPRE